MSFNKSWREIRIFELLTPPFPRKSKLLLRFNLVITINNISAFLKKYAKNPQTI